MRLAALLIVASVVIPAAGGHATAAGAENEPVLEAAPISAPVRPLPGGSDVYRDDAATGFVGNLRTLFTTKIAPSMVGALLLLVLSLLFSTINFYAELRGRQRNLKKAFRYLAIWCFMNYAFALLFLVLILPDGMSLASVSRTLLMYCLVATALPELSANIRLQLGRSEERTLDLYKYKTKVSDLIAKRMDRASAQSQSRERTCLEGHYEPHPDELLRRFRIFMQQGDLSETEQTYLRDKLQDPAVKTAAAMLDVVGQRPTMMRKALEYFCDDIERFRTSPQARLLTEIRPDPTRDEVRRLVGAGITAAGRFLFRTTFAFQRRRLSEATGIPDQRLCELRVSTQDSRRQRRRRRAAVAASGLAAATALLLLLAWHGSRLFPTYEPSAVFAAGAGVPPSAAGAPPPPEVRR